MGIAPVALDRTAVCRCANRMWLTLQAESLNFALQFKFNELKRPMFTFHRMGAAGFVGWGEVAGAGKVNWVYLYKQPQPTFELFRNID